jgi:hypothetical protein
MNCHQLESETIGLLTNSGQKMLSNPNSFDAIKFCSFGLPRNLEIVKTPLQNLAMQ